ncbi:phosphonate ABC transporter ATP-binding protein [Nocardia puris]|uniref:phosphonate ABC transporter ATP-binding protein n=1 Tax=Nocardia puris TaxID=208602 RepID=UPI0018956D27|nr:phosphonate ABC transporter ATP-binding protein [Nocardia puris]MBF6368116.1 phosphonate ABC transporter ATP-binding protein [Nocardia puris]MBF6462750.1 phosphonate ABC transporter ATP-binding protein [Nocardia puris]
MTRAPATAISPTGAATAPAIELRDVIVRFPGGRTAVDGVGLRVRRGEIVALVGTNGAGKSTLLRCVIGLQRPSAGAVVVGGTDLASASRGELREVRRRTGFVFQRSHLIGRMGVFDTVLQGAAGRHGLRCLLTPISPASVRAEAMECLDRVGLADRAGMRLAALSGGQQQRVAIARMLMQRPSLILADEPIASLDPAAAERVLALLRDCAADSGATVVLALHQSALALEYCDRVVGLGSGRIVLDRPAADCDETTFDAVYGGAVS